MATIEDDFPGICRAIGTKLQTKNQSENFNSEKTEESANKTAIVPISSAKDSALLPTRQ